ncbi:helix-turn-helix domain-containing protein [Paraburkholderia sp. RL17-381-BIF-C]|uniref:helix-turn-helix domain-containing protein n=1 Tax=Paraburkholderia sp. RL17-381-BIF-C TaxID=3031635 RepID=UPI0038B9B60F
MSRFIVLPARLLSDARLTSVTHLRVLMALCSYTDKHGWAWPSRKKLAERMSVDGSTVSLARVSQCVADLKSWGYLEAHSWTRESDGGQTSNRYRVLFDIGEPDAIPDGDDAPSGDSLTPVSSAYPPVSPKDLPPSKSHEIYSMKVPTNDSLKGGVYSAGEKAADEQFEQAWAAYPKRAGSNSKRDALKAWKARLAAGECFETLMSGVARYAKYCEDTGKTGTEYVKMAATFFGPSRHFAEAWEPPAKTLQRISSNIGPTNHREASRAAAAASIGLGTPSYDNEPFTIDA